MLNFSHVLHTMSDDESISKLTTQLYREGVNERKCFTSVTCGRALSFLAQRWAHLPNSSIRRPLLLWWTPDAVATAISGFPGNLVSSSFANSLRSGGNAMIGGSMHAFQIADLSPQAVRCCRHAIAKLLRSRFLRLRCPEKLLRHGVAYTDPTR